MRLYGEFQAPKVDFGAFTRALHEELTKALAGGARAYLQMVVPKDKEAGVPVWSGASRGTFSELASYVEYAIALAPVGDAPDRVSLGMSTGTAFFDPGSTTPGLYTFTYQTWLPHLIINEYYDARQWGFHLKNPGPYHFQEDGQVAFETYASTVDLPGWDSLLDVVHIRVG